MNTLSYGLLSLISGSPCSGYDLTQRIQFFWNANHSQIYPLLSQLEEMGLVSFEHVLQKDKPDKKIYTITEAGREELRNWFAGPTDPPVVRDEFALKMFSLWLVDQEAVKRLIREKAGMLEAKLCRLEKRTKEMRLLQKPEHPDFDMSCPLFGPRILIEKSISLNRAELEWCHRVLQMLGE
ncbi:MAG: hypothetical protein K0R57_6562 [Paenibacillaceae bacterium]|nr:hypothetical protein [Paenibacillaceae bacterium]